MSTSNDCMRDAEVGACHRRNSDTCHYCEMAINMARFN